MAHEQAGPFNHAGTVITASAGDNGYLDWNSGLGAVEFPAASPHVVAVGGTRLKLGAGSSWSGRDGLERRRRRRRRLQHDLRSPQLAAVAVQLVGGRMCGHARGRGHLRRRGPLHRRGRVGLDQRGMRNELHGSQSQTRAALVHARRHEPRLADHRLGVRPRGRQRRRLLSRLHAVRERARRAHGAARRDVRLQRRMRRTLQPVQRDLGLQHRTGGGRLLEPSDLPRRQRLRRTFRARERPPA